MMNKTKLWTKWIPEGILRASSDRNLPSDHDRIGGSVGGIVSDSQTNPSGCYSGIDPLGTLRNGKFIHDSRVALGILRV